MSVHFCNEDCFEFMKTIRSYSVSLVLSDPPYNISVNASNHMENTDWDKFASDEEYKDFLVRYLKECSRILKDDGAVIIFFSHSKIKVMLEVFKESGLHPDFKFWKSICRQKGAGAKHKLKSQREDFILLSKEKTFRYNNVDNLFNYDNGNVTNILNSYTGEVERPEFKLSDVIYNFKMPYYLSKTEKQIHTCQKSILLLYALIKACSPEDSTVFDGFAGSGSCLIASVLAGRNFVGCEIEKDMYEKAVDWNWNFDYSAYKKEFFKGGWFGVWKC